MSPPRQPGPNNRVFAYEFSKVYPLNVQKAGLQKQIKKESDLETFFAEAPALHPNSALIKGVVCGIRVEEIKDPLMQKIRYLDKLIDELAKGKALDKIMR